MESLSVQSSVPVRRPLVGAALLFIAGMAAARAWPGAPAGGFLAAAGILLGIAVAILRRPWSAPLLHAVVLAAGFVHGALSEPARSPLDLRRLLTRPREQVEAVVAVAGAPSELPRLREDRAVWTFEGRVEAARHTAPGWRTAGGAVRVRMAADPAASPPAYGDRWRMSAVCSVDPSRGDLVLDAAEGSAVRLDTGGGSPLLRWCYARDRKSVV